jgi:lactate dehydrogenase-like 2-hydroxyacid dehydrogenase
MSAQSRLFVSFSALPSVRQLFEHRAQARFNESGSVLTAEELAAQATLCDTLVVTGTDKLSRQAIDLLPDTVRIIATYSVGLEHIDLEAAARRQIAVLNTPEVLTDAVADIALFLVLGAARRATESIALIRGRHWPGWNPEQLPGVELRGKRLGIFGMGRIGRAAAQRAAAFGMQINYCKRSRLSAEEENGYIYHATSEGLMRESEFLLLACPATESTVGFLNHHRIELLPPCAIVVNVARGSVIDDKALIPALLSGRIRAAGLDVFAREPKLDSRYYDLPNVFMTPHIGSSTIEAREAMATTLLDGIDALRRGARPDNRVV